MNRIKYILILLLMASVSWSGEITTSGNSDLESLNPSSTDTIYIASGHTVNIDDNWNAGATDTTVYYIEIQIGGILNFDGGVGRANMCGLVIDGRLLMGPSDTLEVINGFDTTTLNHEIITNTSGYPVIRIDGEASSTRSVIMGRFADSDWPSIEISNAGGGQSLFVANAKIVRFEHGNSYTAGVKIDENDFDDTRFLWHNVYMDSCALSVNQATRTGIKISACSIYTYYGMDVEALQVRGGPDTIINNFIQYDYDGGSGKTGNGVNLYRADSTVFDTNIVTGINFTDVTNKGLQGILIDDQSNDGSDHLIMRHNQILGDWEFGVTTANGANSHGLFSHNTIYGASHENMIFGIGDSAWTVQANIFVGAADGGRSQLTYYGTSDGTDSIFHGVKIYYNTFIAWRNDSIYAAAIAFENANDPAGQYRYAEVEIVGNIIMGAAASVDSAGIVLGGGVNVNECTVDMDRFEYNMLGSPSTTASELEAMSVYVHDGSVLNVTDSSGGNDTSRTVDFVDSSTTNVNLNTGSPAIDAAETILWESIFTVDERGSTPGDCGALQYISPITRFGKVKLGKIKR